jgi:hypothetical protein
MEQQRTTASVNASEAQTRYSNLNTDHLKVIMPIEEATAKIKQTNEQYIADTNAAMTLSKEDYKKLNGGRSFDTDKMLGDIALNKAQIAQALTVASNDNIRTNLMQNKFELEKIEFGLNVYNTIGETVVSPDGMQKLNTHWDKAKGDIQTFVDYVRTDKTLETLNPRLVKAFVPVLQSVLENNKMMNALRAEDAMNTDRLHSENAKKAWNKFGVKSEQEYQIELNNRLTPKNLDFNEMLGMLGVQTKALEANKLTFQDLYSTTPESKSKLSTQYDIDPSKSPAAGIIGAGAKTLLTPGKYESMTP